MTDDLREEIEEALGHVCVPFSTLEECNEGMDTLVLLFLEGLSAVIKRRKSDATAGLLLAEIFNCLSSGDLFSMLSKRLVESVSMIEVYKVGTPDQKRQIKQELKARNLI